ncbi:MAG TPA: type II secretion system protein, partial [Chthoniobacterales bacterium]
MTKGQISKHQASLEIRASSFENCFGFRASNFGFTLIELLVVIAVIIILAGLILSTVGYVQKKGAHSRAEAEIAAISAALENYKSDNGIYPADPNTNSLKPNSMGDPSQAAYQNASLSLYKAISGDADNDSSRVAEMKSYFPFKPNQLYPLTQTSAVTYIRDPFGNCYGYSTVKSSAPSGTDGYNPTFDLWSTGGNTDTSGTP